MSFQTLEAVATRQTVARVNLLPPEIEDARRSSRLRAGLGGALLLVLLAAAGGYALTVGHVSDANAALETEQSRTGGLQAAQARYAEVPKVESQLAEVVKVRDAVTANDIAWYRYVDGIATGAPASTALTSVVFALSDTADASSASTDPLAVAGVGTLSVNGQTKSQDAVAAWMDGLTRLPGIVEPRLSSSTYDPASGLVSFTTTATVTADALSGRQ